MKIDINNKILSLTTGLILAMLMQPLFASADSATEKATIERNWHFCLKAPKDFQVTEARITDKCKGMPDSPIEVHVKLVATQEDGVFKKAYLAIGASDYVFTQALGFPFLDESDPRTQPSNGFLKGSFLANVMGYDKVAYILPSGYLDVRAVDGENSGEIKLRVKTENGDVAKNLNIYKLGHGCLGFESKTISANPVSKTYSVCVGQATWSPFMVFTDSERKHSSHYNGLDLNSLIPDPKFFNFFDDRKLAYLNLYEVNNKIVFEYREPLTGLLIDQFSFDKNIVNQIVFSTGGSSCEGGGHPGCY